MRAEDLPGGKLALGQPLPERPAYLRTYEQLRGDLTTLAQARPDIVSIHDVGPSADTLAGTADRSLFAVRIRAGQDTGPRPKLMVIGGIHADETANPEFLTREIEHLVSAYGVDPVITRLLDEREIVAVPMANPDGRAIVEQGFVSRDPKEMFHRTSGRGVDLNRNFDFHFGEVGGSTDPSSKNYRGASAASEPEVQALQRFIEAEHPNLLLDWHSRGRLVLLPYGHTDAAPPDEDGLRALAAQLASRAGYTPESSYEFHPDSATLKDWAYGTLGIPAFTIETGMHHHQDATEFATTAADGAALLRYALDVTDAPLARAQACADAAAGAATIAA